MESFLSSLFLAQSLPLFPVLPFHPQKLSSRIQVVHVSLYMVGPLTCAFTNAYLSPYVLASILNDSNVENRKYTGYFLGQILSDVTAALVTILSVSYLHKWWLSVVLVFSFSPVF